ncbi:hypothetical protein ACR3K2_18380 [Cryptosporidium serpentis]
MFSWLISKAFNRNEQDIPSNYMIQSNKDQHIFSETCNIINTELLKITSQYIVINNEINRLDSEHREKLIKHYVKDNTIRSIAESRNVESKIEIHLNNLKRILNKALEEFEKRFIDICLNLNIEDFHYEKEIMNHLYKLLEILHSNDIILNFITVLGYLSVAEQAIILNIISILVVSEIRNCQFRSFISGIDILNKDINNKEVRNCELKLNRSSIIIDEDDHIKFISAIFNDNNEKSGNVVFNHELQDIEYTNQYNRFDEACKIFSSDSQVKSNINEETLNNNKMELQNNKYLYIKDFSKNEKLLLLGWLEDNCEDLYSILLHHYKYVAISYKIGEIMRDLSSLLGIVQSPEIKDKKIIKTSLKFVPLNIFRNKAFYILKSIIYNNQIFYRLIKLSGSNCFDIASDSISTLRCYLFISPHLTNEFITINQDKFFSYYFSYLIQSSDYVPKRQGLRLLNQLLSLPEMSKLMTQFASNYKYLKVFMILLISELPSISFESFHLFKLFVANPNKSHNIHKILYINKEKLISFLTQFQNNRNNDIEFLSDKHSLIAKLQELKKI